LIVWFYACGFFTGSCARSDRRGTGAFEFAVRLFIVIVVVIVIFVVIFVFVFVFFRLFRLF
jgi:hypothetical protein